MKNSEENRIGETMQVGDIIATIKEVMAVPAFGGESPNNLPKWLPFTAAAQLMNAKSMGEMDLILTAIRDLSNDKAFNEFYDYHFGLYKMYISSDDEMQFMHDVKSAMDQIRAIRIWLLFGEDKYFEWCSSMEILTIQEHLAVKASINWELGPDEEPVEGDYYDGPQYAE